MSRWGPNTIREARKYRYNAWGGNPEGRAYNPDRCAKSVTETGRSALSYQCQRVIGTDGKRQRGHGPDRIFCTQHSPEAEAKRDAASQARFDAQMAVYRRRDERDTQRRTYEDVLVDVAKWIAENKDLVESDEWLARIAEIVSDLEGVVKRL